MNMDPNSKINESPRTSPATGAPGKKRSSAFVRLFKMLWTNIKVRAQIKEDTDIAATIDSITKSIEFRGVNIWILAFATIVASVGLNINSTAVIIGAMLISPLMGPINGVGLSVGIFDVTLLKKSLKNMGIMVLVSLLASTLYFLLSPLSDAQSELLARTRPTIFDVLIAFFCGLAGIIATSRKSQPFTVIAGVAIATALMPPLCTAGYGLATAQFKYFFGAFYLFFLNSFFISLATFFMVRYLDFPQKQYMDPKQHRTVKRAVVIFTVIVAVPSILMAINVVRETAFNSEVIHFVNEIQQTEYFNNVQLIKSSKDFRHKDANGRKSQTVTLSLVGKPLTNEQIAEMQKLMQTKYKLSKAKLIIKQTGEIVDVTKQNVIIEKLIEKKEATITMQDSIITDLKSQISKIKREKEFTTQVAKEVSAQYPHIKKFAVSDMIYYDVGTMQPTTVPVIFLQWDDSVDHTADEKNLTQWLTIRLNVKEIRVVH